MTSSSGYNSELPMYEEERVAVLERLAQLAEADASIEVRVAAIESLGSIVATTSEAEGAEVVQFLRERLDSEETAIRAAAATALGQVFGGADAPRGNTDEDDDPSEPRSTDPFS